MRDKTPDSAKTNNEPSADETKRAVMIVTDLACALIPMRVRPYIFPALVAGGVATGVNVLDTTWRVLGVATTESLSRQSEKMDALIEAFRIAHPDVPVNVPPEPEGTEP